MQIELTCKKCGETFTVSEVVYKAFSVERHPFQANGKKCYGVGVRKVNEKA